MSTVRTEHTLTWHGDTQRMSWREAQAQAANHYAIILPGTTTVTYIPRPAQRTVPARSILRRRSGAHALSTGVQ